MGTKHGSILSISPSFALQDSQLHTAYNSPPSTFLLHLPCPPPSDYPVSRIDALDVWMRTERAQANGGASVSVVATVTGVCVSVCVSASGWEDAGRASDSVIDCVCDPCVRVCCVMVAGMNAAAICINRSPGPYLVRTRKIVVVRSNYEQFIIVDCHTCSNFRYVNVWITLRQLTSCPAACVRHLQGWRPEGQDTSGSVHMLQHDILLLLHKPNRRGNAPTLQ